MACRPTDLPAERMNGRGAELGVPLVDLERGPLVEAFHRGTIAVVDASGELLAWAGDPRSKVTYMRSAAKPWQVMPLVLSGAADAFDLEAADIAVCAASHNGEPMHVERVGGILARLGLPPEALACGTHPPLNPAAAAELSRAGASPTALHNNCSGTHAAMLATAHHLGAPLDNYGEPEHTVQRLVVDALARFTGLGPAAIVLGMDDCAAPCHGMSVYHMALAYARLMRPGGNVSAADAAAAASVRDAMAAHPAMVAGVGRIDTDLMAVSGGSLVVKGGASGVQCIGHADGIGIALKIEDGATGPWIPSRPSSVATMEVLRQLELLDESAHAQLRGHAEAMLTDRNGRTVGGARAVFSLERPEPR